MKELSLDTLSIPIHLQVVSHTPDRIRLRLPDHYQDQQVITQIASSLKVFFPQIEKVKTSFTQVASQSTTRMKAAVLKKS